LQGTWERFLEELLVEPLLPPVVPLEWEDDLDDLDDKSNPVINLKHK
jgi:hypothetical protein